MLQISGTGAYAYNGSVFISNAGYYVVSGTLDDGFISVDAYDSSKVWIRLDGVNITSSNNACIRVEEADKVFLTLAENSENFLTSGAEYSESALADGSGGTIFANDDLTINGSGTLTIISGYKHSIDANDYLIITDGTVNIDKCYEGIEAITIDIAGGDITINPSDDGLNANGGSDGFGMPGGFRPGSFEQSTETPTETPAEEAEDDETWVRISGGTLTIINENARDVDGIDSNGDVYISGGMIRVSLSGGGTNNAIDFGSESGGKALISGGNLVAAGGSMMSENFDESSKQPVIMYNLSETVEGGTEVLVLDTDGNEILVYTPPQSFNSIFLSCPEMKIGETYTVIIGDTEETLTLDADAVTLGSAGMGSMGGGFFRGGSGGGMGRGCRGGKRVSPTATAEGSSESGEMPKPDGIGMPGPMMPPDGQIPTFDETSMPEGDMPGGPGGMTPPDGQWGEFDGTMTPPDGMPGSGRGMEYSGMGNPMGPDFDRQQEAEEVEEEMIISTKKALSEFDSKTWILLGCSAIVLLSALLFALKFKR